MKRDEYLKYENVARALRERAKELPFAGDRALLELAAQYLVEARNKLMEPA